MLGYVLLYGNIRKKQKILMDSKICIKKTWQKVFPVISYS